MEEERGNPQNSVNRHVMMEITRLAHLHQAIIKSQPFKQSQELGRGAGTNCDMMVQGGRSPELLLRQTEPSREKAAIQEVEGG
jgi:hypothetical protein